MHKKIAVIGGGASGMIAAIASARKKDETLHADPHGNSTKLKSLPALPTTARHDADLSTVALAKVEALAKTDNVTIFEKANKLGQKVLITGNGRCNITNRNVSWRDYNGTHPKFAASVLAQFSNDDTIEFFEKLGLILIEEDAGRLFPRSNQAQSVVDILKHELARCKVNIKYNQKIKHVNKSDGKFTLTTYQGKQYQFDKLIIATGGKTFPKTGSTGDGYRFAETFSHTMVKPFPVSTPFRIKSIICNKLCGIKVLVELKVMYKDKVISKNTGELLFTHLGISAPVVLESSRRVSEIFAIHSDADVTCSINFFPEYSTEQLQDIMTERLTAQPDKSISNQFIGMLPKKVAPTILQYEKIDPEIKSKNISPTKLNQIIEKLKNCQLKIMDVLSWETAQFTAGGVSVKEINSQTMESKLVPNLYFCGEVVDIDGNSGGYNLQWAWSSGWTAGKAAAL